MNESGIELRQHDSFYFEARRLAAERDRPLEDVPGLRAALIFQAHQQERDPWIKEIVKIRSLAMPTIAMVAGEVVRLDDGLSDECRKTVAMLEAQLEKISAKYQAMLD